VPKPPDLRKEPPREKWDEGVAKETAEHCRKIYSIRHKDDLSSASRREWLALSSLHTNCWHSEMVPNLPIRWKEYGNADTEEFLAPGDECSKTFDGTPRKLIPILKQLIRFDRPLITWDIFNEPAPPVFPNGESSAGAGASARARAGPPSTSQYEEARDPRTVNCVCHMEHSHAQQKKNMHEMDAENFAKTVDSRLAVKDLEDKKLYIVRIDEADGELMLAVVQLQIVKAKKKVPARYVAWWFRRLSQSHKWPQEVKFERHTENDVKETWISDDLEPDAILLPIPEAWLDASCLGKEDWNPILKPHATACLREFAMLHKLHVEKPPKKGGRRGKGNHCPPAPELGGAKRKTSTAGPDAGMDNSKRNKK